MRTSKGQVKIILGQVKINIFDFFGNFVWKSHITHIRQIHFTILRFLKFIFENLFLFLKKI
jgi:hypothetical protein